MAHGDFDDRARGWDDEFNRREHARRVGRVVADALADAPVADVLEIGAGTGLLAFALADALGGRAARFTLADTSAGMREVAQEKIDAAGVPWTVTAEDLSTADATTLRPAYDVVLTHMALHHVADVRTLLRAARSVLRPGGALVALDLTEDNDGFHVHGVPEHGPGGNDPHYHHEGFSEAELRQLCAEAGFTDVEHGVPLTVTRTRDGVDREFPLFLLVAR